MSWSVDPVRRNDDNENKTNMTTNNTNTVRLHRVLRATPERVYRAFLDADAMAKWLPPNGFTGRSEEHTSELQSQSNLVCRLLLEKKKQQDNHTLHLIALHLHH